MTYDINIEKPFNYNDAKQVINDLKLDDIHRDNSGLRNKAAHQLTKLYKVFVGLDATLVEVNPWAITCDKDPFSDDAGDDIVCVDAKICIDDNAKFRQEEIVSHHMKNLPFVY